MLYYYLSYFIFAFFHSLGSSLTDSIGGQTCYYYNSTKGPMNVAYYSRFYSVVPGKVQSWHAAFLCRFSCKVFFFFLISYSMGEYVCFSLAVLNLMHQIISFVFLTTVGCDGPHAAAPWLQRSLPVCGNDQSG
jgi:hypothetical protein